MRVEAILCPVDFSPFSRHALDYAAVLACWYRARLVVLHVSSPLPNAFSLPLSGASMPRVSLEAVGSEMVEFVSGIATMVDGAQTMVRSGDPVDEILRCAEETRPDLMVLGTHGRSGFERLVLGSVTEKLLLKAPCPVLTVPRRVESGPQRPLFDRILCGIDFSEASARALEYAWSLAEEGGGQLTLLHVLDLLPEEERGDTLAEDITPYRRLVVKDARTRLDDLVSEHAKGACRALVRLECGKPYRAILRVAEDSSADLVVLGIHGRNPLDRMLFGSTAQHVTRRAGCPVLTVRPPGAE
jgi:nucleotide-binding universal stress UspA family protein